MGTQGIHLRPKIHFKTFRGIFNGTSDHNRARSPVNLLLTYFDRLDSVVLLQVKFLSLLFCLYFIFFMVANVCDIRANFGVSGTDVHAHYYFSP